MAKRIRAKRKAERVSPAPPCLLRIRNERIRESAIFLYRNHIDNGHVRKAEKFLRHFLHNPDSAVRAWVPTEKHKDKFLSVMSQYSRNKTDPKYFEHRGTEPSRSVEEFSVKTLTGKREGA